MNKKHKHAELIKAWANGATIQRKVHGKWEDCQPKWDEYADYRIKPELKPDVVIKYFAESNSYILDVSDISNIKPNLELIWDGETGELKSAEVLK